MRFFRGLIPRTLLLLFQRTAGTSTRASSACLLLRSLRLPLLHPPSTCFHYARSAICWRALHSRCHASPRSRVAKDTPGLSSLVSTQTDITDILDPRIPYDGDSSSRRHLLSGDSEYSLAESNLRRPLMSATASLPQLRRELDELNTRSDRRMGGSFAIKFVPASFNRILKNDLCHVKHFNYLRYLDSLQPDDGGMPRTRQAAKRAAERKVCRRHSSQFLRFLFCNKFCMCEI